MSFYQNCKGKFCTNLHSNLLLLFVVCVIQFIVVFHWAQVQNENRRESQLVELLKAVQEQNNILQKRSLPEEIGPRQASLKKSNLKDEDGIPGRCETIHVAIVCAGYTSARTVVTLLKSILFYRRNPIHFHLIVNLISRNILENLLVTWDIPSLKYSFYSTDALSPAVSWVRNSHYSGKYGLMKLVIQEALPKNVSRVLVLDTDITFNSDIAELWNTFSKFTKVQALGLVENQSSWYLGKFRWPALGQGFNSGVIMMDLSKLRSIRWRNLWKTIAVMQLRLRNRTELADQDIFNAVFKEHPELCYKLPCEWNVQLNENSKKSENCYLNGAEPKVIHWNTFQKALLQDRHNNFFRKMYLTFVEYDGNLLRKEVLGCGTAQSGAKRIRFGHSSVRNVSDRCDDMKRASSLVYRTHIFFLPFNASDMYPELDVTFVTQLSLDRMLMLETLAMQWPGPISAAVFSTDTETESLIEFVSTSTVLRRRKNIAYHIVYKDGGNSQAFYPVNYLRNVAMDQAMTPYVLLADVDFVPKLKMRDYLIDAVKNTTSNDMLQSKVALVLPPFETSLHRFFLPITKKLLLMLWDRNLVLPFRFSMWKPGQFPVNYTNWKTAVEPYEVEWTPYFEPYVVVPRNAPRFDPRFVGFGWNKVAHSMALHAEGYKFVVLPEAFLVHLPHSPSMSNNKFRLDYHYRRCMHKFKQEFLLELEMKYKNTAS